MADYGVAKVQTTATSDTTDAFAGNAAYRCPMAAHTGVRTTASDVYSMGVMLLQLILGEPDVVATKRIAEALREGDESAAVPDLYMPGDQPRQVVEAAFALALACTRIDSPNYRPKMGVRPGAPPDDSTVLAQLEAMLRHGEEPHVLEGRLQTFLLESAAPPLQQREVQSLKNLASNIALTKLQCWVQRPALMQRLAQLLQEYGVCVLHGFGGVGKSTAAAMYAYRIVSRMLVRWLPSEDATLLLQALEQLAEGLQLKPQELRASAGVEPSAHRRELAR